MKNVIQDAMLIPVINKVKGIFSKAVHKYAKEFKVEAENTWLVFSLSDRVNYHVKVVSEQTPRKEISVEDLLGITVVNGVVVANREMQQYHQMLPAFIQNALVKFSQEKQIRGVICVKVEKKDVQLILYNGLKYVEYLTVKKVIAASEIVTA